MSTVFVDTSAFYALLDAADDHHARAREALRELRAREAALVTSSYVLHETVALLQARLGLDAVRGFHRGLAPLLRVVWIDESFHELGMASLVTSGRGVSLTDWTSFEVMRAHGIRHALAFDEDFAAEGFEPA